MAYVGFYRSEGLRKLGTLVRLAKKFVKRVRLDPVFQRVTAAVGFDITDGIRRYLRIIKGPLQG